MDITVVSKPDICTSFGIIFMSTIIQVPPLYIETKSAFVEEEKIKKQEKATIFLETMTRDEKGTSYDGKELIKIMEPIFEDMTKNIMKGFEFLAIQSWEKYIDFKKTKGKMHQLA